MTRRRMIWIGIGAGLVVAIVAGLIALPHVVRRVAAGKIAEATGRPTVIEAVELNLFTGRLLVKAFRLGDRGRPDPFVEFDRLLVRFRLLPLLTGTLRLDEVTLDAPRLRVARTGPAEFNFSDLLVAPAGKEPPEPAKKKGLPVDVTVGRFTLSGGALQFEDAVVAPPQTWKAEGLAVEVTDLSTRTGAPGGSASVRVTLAGTPIALKASEVRVTPGNARATLTFEGFDLALALPYVPKEAPATLTSGRLSASLTLGHTEGTSRADGEVRLENLVVVRRGQTAPSLSAPLITVAIKDVVAAGGAITAGRIEVAGDPTVYDTNLTPPPRFDLKGLKVAVEDAAWPPGKPARVQVAAGLPRNGSLEAQGTARLNPLGADLKVALKGVDLMLALPYVPPTAPATLAGGRMNASLTVGHAPERSRAGGEVRLENLVVVRRGQTAPSLSVPALSVRITNAALAGGAVTLGRLDLAGDPTVYDTNLTPPPRFDLKGLKVAVEGATWPSQKPARVQVASELPGGGTLDVRGTAQFEPLGADLRVVLKGADLVPYQSYIPINAPLAGKADAEVAVVASLKGDLTATVRGKGGVGALALGPPDAPVVRVERADATGIDVRWPTNIVVERVVIQKPNALVERDEQGALPLLAMLRRPSPAAAGPSPAPPAPPPAPVPPGARSAPAIEIGEIVVEEGYGRFVDRTLSPPHSEELSRLAVSLKGLSNAPGKRGRLTVQGVVGATGAIQLQGEVAPLGEKLFVDLEGELRDFAIPRNNAYLDRFLAWIARDGRLSTKFRLRIDGDTLDASSEIVVGRLDVAPSGDRDEVKRRIGLPLGLIVALMKDGRGEIRVNVPVSGSLSAPEFSLGEAIWAAVRNVIVNVVTAPFKLIGRLFTRDDKIENLAIDPILFAPGSATVAGPVEEQLKRVAEFLRNTPAIRIGLSAVVSQEDMASLKTQEVTARVQRIQREQRLPDLAAAAARLFAERFPGKPAPKTPEEAVAALRDAEPAPEEAGRVLAARRLEVAREALVKAGGIDPQRLQPGADPPPLGAPGEGRVEVVIAP